jgi:enoyl-CoA hydratase
MNDQAVLTERRDGVLLITLNRPDARNAVNLALAEGVAAALDTLDEDAELSVGVLTGAGKGFSSGMDLKAFVTGERPYVGDRGFAGITQRSARKPLVAAGGALRQLPQRMSYGAAMELALTGDTIDAERGHELGLVDRVAEPGGAVDAALELAAAISRNGPLALTATKEILKRQRDWSDAEFWAKQGEISGPVFVSEDAREGAVAFSEKRDPVWKGQ